MNPAPIRPGWLPLALGLFLIGASPAIGADETPIPSKKLPPVPIKEVSEAFRDKVRGVIDNPTLRSRGLVETFACKPTQYQEFLDHPDKAMVMWRKLGAKCVTITDCGKGRFAWKDDNGSEVHWDTVYKGNKMRIWYAEGKVRSKALLPAVAVRAVVVFHYTEGHDERGRSLVQHQAEMFLHTDNVTAALMARLLGPAAPRLADQYVSQLQSFFAALAWYCQKHPEATK